MPLSGALISSAPRQLNATNALSKKPRKLVLTSEHLSWPIHIILLVCLLMTHGMQKERIVNSVGQCYTPDALNAILTFCNKHRIHLISDEIYAFSVYNTNESSPGFTSVLSLDTTGVIDSSLVHVMYGMSKVNLQDVAIHC